MRDSHTDNQDLIRDDLAGADERALMGQTSGHLYMLSALVVIGGQALPATDSGHTKVALALGVYVLLFGLGGLTGWIPWERAPWWQHKLAGVALMPISGVILWATGGAVSYALPLLILPLFFISYFYRPAGPGAWSACWWSWPRRRSCTTIERSTWPIRQWSFAVAVSSFTLTAVVVWLKSKLVDAERRQRTMALRDARTLMRVVDRQLHDAKRGRDAHGTQALVS